MALDTETTSLDALNASLVGVCMAVAPGRAAYLPLRHEGTDMLSPAPEQLPFDAAMGVLRPLLADVPVIASAHPSPLSARSGFFGSRPFSRTNAALEAQRAQPIDWRLRDVG